MITWNAPSSLGGGARSPRLSNHAFVLPGQPRTDLLAEFSALLLKTAPHDPVQSTVSVYGFFGDTYPRLESLARKLSSPVWYLTVLWILKETHKELAVWSLVVMIVINFMSVSCWMLFIRRLFRHSTHCFYKLYDLSIPPHFTVLFHYCICS